MKRQQSALPAIASALWDLRDHIYDNAEQWAEVGPDTVFQAMAEIVERVIDTGDEMDWINFPGMVTASLLPEVATDS